MLISGLSLLLLSGATPTWSPVAEPPPVLRMDLDKEFQALEKELKSARFQWRRARRAAKKDGVSFDLPDPLAEHFPRFDALAAKGSADALVWVGLNAESVGLSADEVVETKRRVFGRLAEEFAGHGATEDFVKKAKAQVAFVPVSELAGWLEAIFEANEDLDIRTRAAYELAQVLSSSRSEEDHSKAEAWCRRIVKEFPDHKMARRAQESLDALKYSVGRIAPDFTTQDVDGIEFKLSDYRGKVVVLDFWGFW